MGEVGLVLVVTVVHTVVVQIAAVPEEREKKCKISSKISFC